MSRGLHPTLHDFLVLGSNLRRYATRPIFGHLARRFLLHCVQESVEADAKGDRFYLYRFVCCLRVWYCFLRGSCRCLKPLTC